MFKNQKAQSGLRYCMRATELPYARLVEYSEFTVAVARVSERHRFPADPRNDGPRLFGVLHDSSTFIGGDEEPMLPVEVAFLDRPLLPGQPIGSGHMDHHYGAKEHFFVLRLAIVDPRLVLFQKINQAMERGALSRERFMHLWCGRDLEKKAVREGSIAEQLDRTRAFLKTIEAGDAHFPDVSFDEVRFSNELNLHSPAWAWAWNEFEQGGPTFFSKGVASWRAGRAKWFK